LKGYPNKAIAQTKVKAIHGEIVREDSRKSRVACSFHKYRFTLKVSLTAQKE